MERDGLRKKDGVGRNPRETKFKDPWDYNSHRYLGGFSWPPRSYTCSFCKREFRSAQALGGHMNVHRRDRARLRQSPPPWVAQDSNPNLNPKLPDNPTNPNPSSSSSTPSSRPLPITYAFPRLLSSSSPPPPLACFSPSPPSTSSSSDAWITEMATPMPSMGPLHLKGDGLRTKGEAVNGLFDGKYEEDFLGRREPVKLDLEIGLCGNPTIEDLDLELRLGNS